MNFILQILNRMAQENMIPNDKGLAKIRNATYNKVVRYGCVGDKPNKNDAYLILRDGWRGVFGHHRRGITCPFFFKSENEFVKEPKSKPNKNHVFGGLKKESELVDFVIIDSQKQSENLDAIEAQTRLMFNRGDSRFENHHYLTQVKRFSGLDLMKVRDFSTNKNDILPRVNGDRLLLPIVNQNGRLMSFQRIAPDGTKRMMSGGIVKGHFIPVTQVFKASETANIVITEGYASGVAVKLLYPECHVVAALFADNLLPVGLNIREKFPFANLIYGCDYDGARQALPGEPTGNIGLLKARDAAFMTRANLLIPPVDPENPNQSIDWWDIWASKGGDHGN